MMQEVIVPAADFSVRYRRLGAEVRERSLAVDARVLTSAVLFLTLCAFWALVVFVALQVALQ